MLERFIRAVRAIKRTPSQISLVKSERINALRKQFDAFLEEDKKRKSRNEYILGWLDRVRTSTTITPVRYKENQCDYSQELITKSSEYLPRFRTPDPHRNIVSTYRNLDETAILKEISKSYILIPKKHSVPDIKNRFSIPTSSSITNLSNDTDWKSKYDILNEIKQNDEEYINKKHQDVPQTCSVPEKLYYDKYDFPEKDNNSDKHININETPEQINIENNGDELRKTNDYLTTAPQDTNKYDKIKCNETLDHTKNNSLNDEKIHVANKDTMVEDSLKKIDNDFTKNPEKFIPELNVVNNENLLLTPENQRIINTDNGKTHEFENGDLNKINEDLNQRTQEIKFKEKENDILNNFKESVNHDFETKIPYTDKNEYKDLNNQNICQTESNDNKQHVSTTQNSDFINVDKLESTERIEENITNLSETQEIIEDDNEGNINLKNEDIPKSFEESNLIGSGEQFQTDIETTKLKDTTENDTSQIKEYEDEQKNMFYSENPNENYAYNEKLGGNAAENETYENNEQYSYYEAVKDEANYGPEINEHAESTEPYDPNYEQQYDNQYVGNPTQYQNENYEQGYYNVEEQNQEYQQEQYQNYDQQNYEQQYHQSDNPVEQQQYDNVYDNHIVEQENPNVTYEQDVLTTQISNDESQGEKQVKLENSYHDNDEIGNEGVESVPQEEISQVEQTTDLERS
ncbi:LOW QUALITY PROTEIN: putative uncharacterized protein DDB_G0289963 [Colias croceus]|uniref:LOW QUALITY PROTEIN: putative uncharacterized protein DDB_G0289963 n=1 Tax=Colias crocea TaxID=72248 RepID=UPI001E27CC6A|nr:LOW QUALITY PROTEIN: putative uncharacterized protein DDB_G0289963 [Colias croceus]